ncbi:large conductance mechanosensitive channel protein MscL [Quadrisphaera sp. DSM 44207]|uniref:large conductance mechanosensitive channel protein MscL n=1 Tax=Quadrisphaera sp. DSM 44207 TaxID=1881057 RepID=UPI00088812AA|nr:large conductance mechanosensitive channel protein MscL [Quadrisphaera sp. DSM 44207]SDQ66113.1 large conductance mechanosensitive channel [Quadrisphaera sp. DSM 44207]
MARNALSGFKDFILRGNVVDLAVAVVVGAAFTAVVDAIAVDFFGSLLAAVSGVQDGELQRVGIPTGVVGSDGRPTVLSVGPFLAALLQFLIVSAVLYFLVLRPTNRLLQRRARGEEPEPVATPEDVALLREIRDLLRAQQADGAGSGASSAAPRPPA